MFSFSEVFDLQMGKTPSRDNKAYWGGNNIWVSIADMNNRKYISSSKETITDLAVHETGIRKVPKGTVFMSFKLSIGKVCIAAEDLYTNEAIMQFPVKKEHKIIPEYLYYYLQGHKWQGANKAVMGATLNKKTIAQERITYPTTTEQQRIVNELDLLNDIISKRDEQLKILDKLAETIFYEMFGNPILNEKKWDVQSLEELVTLDCPISYGIVQPGDGETEGVPVVRPLDMIGVFTHNKGLKNTTKEISDSYKRTILKGNELLLCVRGTTGIVSLAAEDLKGCNVSRGITPLEFKDDVSRWFMLYQFKTAGVQNIIADLTHGIALKGINMADVRKLKMIKPSFDLQKKFEDKVSLLYKQQERITISRRIAENLLASRMNKYFSE